MATGSKVKREHSEIKLNKELWRVRDCLNLWVVRETLQCASIRNCIPCAYKIACFDVAMDTEFCREIPNQRPELCPRSKMAEMKIREGVLGFGRTMKVLTVGDGDFSFSLALARMGVSLAASSYEKMETLEKIYPNVKDTIEELQSLGAKVYFGVDATKLDETLPKSARVKYDRIVWNFPCSAIAKGQDGQNEEMEFNKSLVRSFLLCATDYIQPHAHILMNHKTKVRMGVPGCYLIGLYQASITESHYLIFFRQPPFNQWRIEDVALGLHEEQDRQLYHFVGRVVMDRNLFPPYVPRKALDRKSFPVHDACTYVFARVKVPMLAACSSTTDPLVPVTPELLQSLRGSLLQTKQPSSMKRKRCS